MAVVIAALRAAHGNQRGCRLIAFGGPGELLEGDLAGRGGLTALLDFMGMGFDGGTDIQTPIERALARVHALSQAKVLQPYQTQRLAKDGSVLQVTLVSTALLNPAGVMYAIATTERLQGVLHVEP